MTTPNQLPEELPGSLWCICAYFNPLGLESRKDNFSVFYQSMMEQGVNLLCAESALHERGFNLDTIVSSEQLPVQIHNNNILWQKERLLNMLLNHLPDDCDKVCWLDCDILFAELDWQDKVNEALQQYKLVQPYAYATHLPGGVNWIKGLNQDSFPDGLDDCCKSYSYLAGLLHPQIQETDGHTGFAWAARRSVLEEARGFYDASIMGGGDFLMSRAAVYQHHSVEVAENHSRFQMTSFIPWAQRFNEAVDFSVGFCGNTIYHLWHGKQANKLRVERLALLQRLDFDPRRDIFKDDNGLWDWTEEGQRFIPHVEGFFKKRLEGQ